MAAVRLALLALLAALVAAGCGDSGGGTIKPEGSAKSPMAERGEKTP